MKVIDASVTAPDYDVVIVADWAAKTYAAIPAGATALPVQGVWLSELATAVGTARVPLRIWDDMHSEVVEGYFDADNKLRCTSTTYAYVNGAHVESTADVNALYGIMLKAIVAGTDGEDGTDGADGADGADGSLILYGSGVPSNSTGSVNDTYIDTATANVYTKGDSAWVFKLNLRGSDGADGASGQAHFMHVRVAQTTPTAVTRNVNMYADASTVYHNNITGASSVGGVVTLPAGSYSISGSSTSLLRFTITGGELIGSLGYPVVVTDAEINVDSSEFVGVSSYQSYGAANLYNDTNAFQDLYPICGVVTVEDGSTAELRFGVHGDWGENANVTATISTYQLVTIVKV